MKTGKRIIVWALFIAALPLLAAAGAYLLVDDATVAALIIQRIEQASGARISYKPDAVITRTLSPTFSVNDLAIENAGRGYRLHTSFLHLQISLADLFVGRLDVPRLALGDTRVEIRENGAAGDLTFPAPLPLKPVLHDVSIGSLSVMLAGEEISLPATHISDLAIRPSPETDQLMLAVKIFPAGREMQINALLPTIQSTLQNRLLPFSLTALAEGIDLSAEGRLDFNHAPASIAASIRGQLSDPGRLLPDLKGLPPSGRLTAEARLSGTFAQLAMEDLSASWQGPGQSRAELSGHVTDVMKLAGVELNLTGHVDESAWLAPLLPASLGTLKSADLTATLTGSSRQLALRDLNLQAKTQDALDLQLTGKTDLAATAKSLAPANIDLHLRFGAPTTRAARFLLFDKVWELGAITGRADIRSATGDPAISNIIIQTKDPQGIAVELTGAIGSFPLDADRPNTGYALAVTMKSTSTSVMAERLGIALPLSGPLDVRYSIEGDTQALQLNAIKLSAGDSNGVQVDARGQVWFGNWDLADPLKSIDLTLEMQSRDSKALSAVTGKELPDLGGLSARGRLHTVDGSHRIDDFLITTAPNAPLQATLAGSSQRFTFVPKPAVDGIQLALTATAADTAKLNILTPGRNMIPAIGPFKAAGQITGSDRQIMVSELSASAGRKDILLVTAQGRLGSMSAADNWHPRDTNLHVIAQSTQSNALTKALGYQVPELGPLAAQADLLDKSGKAGLHSFHLLVGDRARPTIDAQGSVSDLLAGSGIHLEAKLNLDGHTLAAFADKRALPDLQPLVGDMVISNDDGTLGIDSLHLASNHSDLMSLQIDGRFSDFHKPDTLALDASLTARDLQLLGALFDQEWPPVGPVALSSQLHQQGATSVFATELTAGQTSVHSAIDVLFDSKPPRISGTITAQNISLPQRADKTPASSKKKKPAATPVFSREPLDLHWLQMADCDLVVDIESFVGEQSQIKSARLEIINKSGKLTINPARIIYPQGEINFDLRLDAQQPLQVSFKAFGKDINPWQTFDLQDAKSRNDFAADMDVDVSLTSSGASPHELASNMAGNIFLTITHGKIRKQLLDLVFVDLVGWSTSKVLREKYANIECGVADYSVKHGLISTNALFIDSKDIAIAGQGVIDLGEEKIDYAFLPRKKSRLIHRADPVNVKGPLRDPSVKVIPWKSAATTYGGLFFAPYIFVGMVAADWLSDAINFRSKKSPCEEYLQEHPQNQETGGEKSIP